MKPATPALRLPSQHHVALFALVVFGCSPHAPGSEQARVGARVTRQTSATHTVPACASQPRPLAPGEALLHGGGEAFAQRFVEAYGLAMGPTTEQARATTLRVDLDLEHAVVWAPTGTPGPRQRCVEWVEMPVELELELGEAVLRFSGTGTAALGAFEVSISDAELTELRGPWVGPRVIKSQLVLHASGSAEGSLVHAQTRAPIVNLSFDL